MLRLRMSWNRRIAMTKETSNADKCIGMVFAMTWSFTCFAFSAVEESSLKGLYLLFFAVFGAIILPVVFLWPRSERTSGSRSSGVLKLNLSKGERCSVFKVALSSSLAVLFVYMFVWVYMKGRIAGLVLIICSIIALACCLIRVSLPSVKCEPSGDERLIDRMSTCRRKMGRSSCTPEFLLFKKRRWLIYLVLMGVVTRIVVMCVLHGVPSFCPNCILYWGKHNFNGSGMHLPEYALFML